MARALVVSGRDLAPALGHTILWRSDIERRQLAEPEQALAAIRELRPNLVLLDASEPDAAAGFVRRVRAEPELRETALVVLTRDAAAGCEEGLRQAGANLALAAPVDPDLWDARLEELLQVPRRRDARIPVRLAAWSRAEPATPVQALALNISVRGLLVESPLALAPGTRLDLGFELPAGQVELEVVGEVVRDAGASDGASLLGVKFLVLKGDARAAISAFVQHSLSGLAPPEPAPPDEASQWEAELRASEARKGAILEAALDAIVTMDADGRILEFNAAAEAMFGRPRREVLGRSVAETLIPPSLRERHRRGLVRHLQTGEHHVLGRRVESQGLRADGSLFPVELAVVPIQLERRRLYTAHVRDVSERKRAEEALAEHSRHLRLLLEQVPAVLWAVDAELRFTSSTGAGLAELGLRPGQVVGLTLGEYFGAGTPGDEVVEHHRRALEGEPTRFETAWLGRRFQVQVEPLREGSGGVIGAVGLALDITARARAESELRASEERYRQLFERNLAGVFRSTLDGRILDCNEAMARVLGYASSRELLEVGAVALYFDPADREAVMALLRERGSLTNQEIRLRRSDGTPVWVLENVALLASEPGVLEGTLIDVTERKLALERVQHQAHHDALSGLPNRSLFTDRLNQALALARRGGHALAVLYMDLDEFKRVNDTLGHSAGDRLLQEVARRLVACLRAVDTVARVGGDEFIVLLPEVGEVADVVQVADKIHEAVARPCDLGGHVLHVTTSIGISLFPGDGNDPETLLRNADNAMYRAKDAGRGAHRLFTPEMNARAVRRLAVEQGLRRALEQGEFALRFQPRVRASDRRVTGFEALLRWRRDGREVEPAEFIELAEYTRLILPIGAWVLNAACAQARAFREQGFPDLSVAVNVSAREFEAGGLLRSVGAALDRAGLDPRALEIEITESVAMHNVEATVATLRQLAEMGVRIALDDFGTGHAALSYLSRFPLHTLKIDQSFVHDLDAAGSGVAIVSAIVEMARALGLTSVAEGVETAAQAELLRERGCDELQGYFFAHPLEPAAAAELLRRSGPAG